MSRQTEVLNNIESNAKFLVAETMKAHGYKPADVESYSFEAANKISNDITQLLKSIENK